MKRSNRQIAEDNADIFFIWWSLAMISLGILIGEYVF